MVLESWIVRIEAGDPFVESRLHFPEVVFGEFDFRPFTHLVFGCFEQIEQGRNRLPIDFRGLRQFPAFISHAVNPAMGVIAIWITEMMLHMADDRVLPVAEINRAVRPNIHRYRAEVRIARTDERFERLAPQAGAVLADFDAVDSLEPDDVGVEKISLELFREKAAGEDGRAGARTGRASPEFLHRFVFGWIIYVAAERRSEVTVVPRAIGDDVVAPIIENAAVRICKIVGDVGFKAAGDGFEAINRGIIVAYGSGGSLDLCPMKYTVAEVDCSARLIAERIGGVVRVG